MSNAILQVDDIQKYYGNKGSLTKAVDHISFQVCKGEFLGIMGASGSGKTTLLNQLYHQIEKKINSNVPEDIKIFHMEF